MGYSNNNSGKTMSMTGGLLAGGIWAVAVTLAGAMALAAALGKGMLDWSDAGIAIVGILLISSYVGTTVSVQKIRRRRFLVCIGACCVYFSALMLITGLFFGGKYEAVGVTLSVTCAGSICAMLTRKGTRSAKGRKNNHKRR